jgi:hypothetical protein
MERGSIYHFSYSKNLRLRNTPPFVYNICIYIISFLFIYLFYFIFLFKHAFIIEVNVLHKKNNEELRGGMVI